MKNSSYSKTFCPRPWVELAVSTTGTLTPCCVFERPILREGEDIAAIWNTKLQDVWNGKHWKTIRQKMLKGKEVAGCKQCYQQESIGVKSKRNEAFKQWRQSINQALLATEQDGAVSMLPQSLDLKLLNKCNLACRMCQPKDSSFVDKQFRKIYEQDNEFSHFQNTSLIDPFLKQDISDIPPWIENPYFLSTMTMLYPSLRNIAFAGGEPFLLEEFYGILEEIMEQGNAQNVEIIISTNLTILPQRFINLVSAFKRVHLCVSIDGFERSLEYIRYPIKWQRFNHNVYVLLDVINKFDNISFSFNVTFQALNALELPAIFEYYNRISLEDKRKSKVSFYLHHVTYPQHLGLHILPVEILEKAQLNLEGMKDKITGHCKEFIYDEIDRANRFIESAKAQKSSTLLCQFISYNKSLDRIRRHSMSSFLPELAESIGYERSAVDSACQDI